MPGVAFDRLHKIGNQIEPSLQLVLHLRPSAVNLLIQSDRLIVLSRAL